MTRSAPRPAGNGHLERRFESARCAHAEGRLKEAERHCRWILKRHPEQPDVLHLLALVMKDRGRLTSAADLLERALKKRPDDPLCLNNLGNVLREQHQFQQAIIRYQAALRLDPEYVSAMYNLGVALVAVSKPDQAVTVFQRVVAKRPDDADAWSQLGAAYLDLGRDQEAMAASRKALEIAPDWADAWNDLGLAHADRGEFEDALRCYRRALEVEPGHVKAALNVSKIRRFDTGDEPEIALVERALAEVRTTAGPRGDLHFALGKIKDDCGNYAEAFDHYEKANRERAKRIKYDAGASEAEVTRLMEIFDAGFFSRRSGFGDVSDLPVFIVGMPRSGTTLVEQILAAHPEVHAAGELLDISELAADLGPRLGSGAAFPACVPEMNAEQSRALAQNYVQRLQARAPDAARIIDKLPGNYMFLGLIYLLLPRARIVYCRRHPLDVALSIYFTDFRSGHHYSYALKDIAAQIRQFLRLMGHWRRVIPVPMLELRYEDVVADSEARIRSLLEFVGLPWDPRCLEFQRVNRAVHTASNWQVRQPLYASSVGRWRRYRQHLGALEEVVEPLAKEAGYELD
ncbi:MAG TPA: sulfotransferase [Gammaproteobacteria bacterium]|nr:sulfotransferase [Gammaproteobacteria bacterium]